MYARWATDFNTAYPMLAASVRKGNKVYPRGKETLEIRPVILDVDKPAECLVTSYGRPVNVTFALAEVLWILDGRKDVGMLKFYNKNIEQFSDDGSTFNAAYGYRMRHAFGYDQIDDVLRTLTDDPDSRQAVINIWHPNEDRGWAKQTMISDTGQAMRGLEIKKVQTKDRACNTQALLSVRDNKLHWVQVQRSNDLVWGTPYNWMQWGHIHRWVSGLLGVEQGSFTHVINSLHAYTQDYGGAPLQEISYYDLYADLDGFQRSASTLTPSECSADLLESVVASEHVIRTGQGTAELGLSPYWDNVLLLFRAHHYYKNNDDQAALEVLQSIQSVYGPAQARFYMKWRWNKDAYKSIRDQIELTWTNSISQWMLYGSGR